MVKLDEIQQFYAKANRSHESTKLHVLSNGEKVMEFTDGDWRLDNTFSDGEQYGGCLMIKHKENPVWTQVYYGQLHDSNFAIKEIQQVLQTALTCPGADVRGPKKITHNGLEYHNTLRGNFASYTGEEKITKDKKTIYTAMYFGGLVAQGN